MKDKVNMNPLNKLWMLEDEHVIYGKVVMVGHIGGEAYRWFDKDGAISMIPLSVLEVQ